jgi:hypothetical protein
VLWDRAFGSILISIPQAAQTFQRDSTAVSTAADFTAAPPPPITVSAGFTKATGVMPRTGVAGIVIAATINRDSQFFTAERHEVLR